MRADTLPAACEGWEDLRLRGRDDIRQWLIWHDALGDHLLAPVHATGHSSSGSIDR